ncbi:uncharacterized protein LOC123473727 isoform X3 [Daphnia magna]|uniref:uncharacterized protein LOC123473727 isoform X3 n=1 Tax=Daphnia magna TaxID=35525 RepID=UPI001E1BAD00|nr:uncharacterized protein LOC123473727 isoform X3 [Daphnia magna]
MKSMRSELVPRLTVIVLFLLLLIGGIGLTEAIDCGRCVCTKNVATGYQNVLCLGIPFTEIKSIFAGNTGFVDINRFDVVPEVCDSIIPANLLGNHRARIIHLASCGINPMEIHSDAFKTSMRTTEEFTSFVCDVGKLTWSFLNGFTSLNFLQLEGVTKIQSLGSLPSLPSLKRFTITNCQGFAPLSFPGTSLTGLQTLIMTDNGAELTNEKLDSILATLVNAKSFQVLKLTNNTGMSRIPSALSVLSALHTLDLSLCSIPIVSSSSLSFTAPAVKALNLEKTSLSTIVDNTFNNRYYGNAKVLLDGNNLQEFRSSIYFKILVDMKTATTGEIGSLSVTNNPIKCDDCQLAWLIRDSRELLPFVNGACSNGTNFRDLIPSWYDDQSCDTLTTTPLPTTLTSISTSIEPTSTSESTSTAALPSISSTGSGSTNISTLAPPDAESYDTLFYILYGILGGIGLILIIGFVYLGWMLARRRKARARSSDVSSLNSSIAPGLHPVPDPLAVNHRASYAPMNEPVPPRTASNNFNQHPTGKQYHKATATIITPYRPTSSAHQPPTAEQSGRVRGLKRVQF